MKGLNSRLPLEGEIFLRSARYTNSAFNLTDLNHFHSIEDVCRVIEVQPPSQ